MKRVKKRSDKYCYYCGRTVMSKSFVFILFFALIIIFLTTLFLVRFLWSWVIPDLFPGAVSQGLIAGSISWLTTFKVALFISVLSFLSHLLVGKRCYH